MRESELVKATLQQINYFGYFWRNNTGARKIEENGSSRFIRFGHVGSADIIGVANGRFVAFEAKSDRGRQTENQRMFQAEIERHRGIYVLYRRPEEALEIAKDIYESKMDSNNRR